MAEIISIRLTDENKKKLLELKKYYKEHENIELTTSDILKAGLNNFWAEKILSNKSDST